MSAKLKMVFIAFWPAILTLALIAVIIPATAQANGRVVSFDRRIAGPYEIAVGTIPGNPVVGTLHLTMTVTNVEAQTLIVGADITVTGKGPESDVNEIGPLVATSDPADPTFYDVSTSVDRVGMWTLTVSVSSDLGEASADFPVEVRTSSPLTGIITLVAVLAFVIVIGFSVRAYLRERGRSRKQKAESRCKLIPIRLQEEVTCLRKFSLYWRS